MKLALAFHTPLHLLLNLMSAEEMTLWQAFDERDPISLHHRVDLGAGVIAATNINKNIPKGEKNVNPSDFMPVFQSQRAEEKASAGMGPAELKEFMLGEIAKQEARKKLEERVERFKASRKEKRNGPRPPHSD